MCAWRHPTVGQGRAEPLPRQREQEMQAAGDKPVVEALQILPGPHCEFLAPAEKLASLWIDRMP